MKYARIPNGMAADVRDTHPHGYFTPDIAAEFVPVPDTVQDGYLYDGVVFTAPPVPTPPTQAELDAIAAAQKAADLTRQRAALLLQIDTDTDALYKAVIGERATEYAQAETDAQAYHDAGYTGTVPSSVAGWSAAKKKTDKWAADDILATALAWRTAQTQIRATRLGAKEAARVATDVAPVAANWAAFLVAAKAGLGVA